MSFTVLQKNRELPDPAALQRAFRQVPGLVALDADRLCQDVVGLLARNFTRPQAEVLQAALQAEGIEAEAVEQAHLPALPVGKVIRRIDFTPDALMIHDPLRPRFPVEWRQVTLLAAGCVSRTAFPRSRRAWLEVQTHFVHGIPVQVRKEKFEYASREASQWVFRAEVVLEGGKERFSIEAEDFDFACLGNQAKRKLEADFGMLVQELARHAPQAVLNQGASLLLAETPELFGYPRPSYLTDELIWLLWWLGQAQPGLVSQ